MDLRVGIYPTKKSGFKPGLKETIKEALLYDAGPADYVKAFITQNSGRQ